MHNRPNSNLTKDKQPDTCNPTKEPNPRMAKRNPSTRMCNETFTNPTKLMDKLNPTYSHNNHSAKTYKCNPANNKQPSYKPNPTDKHNNHSTKMHNQPSSNATNNRQPSSCKLMDKPNITDNHNNQATKMRNPLPSNLPPHPRSPPDQRKGVSRV